MKCSPSLLAAAATALLLAACGQKGPLVLPDAPKPKRTVPAVPGGLRRAPATAQPPAGQTPPAPAQAGEDAAPLSSPPVTPATSSPR